MTEPRDPSWWHRRPYRWLIGLVTSIGTVTIAIVTRAIDAQAVDAGLVTVAVTSACSSGFWAPAQVVARVYTDRRVPSPSRGKLGPLVGFEAIFACVLAAAGATVLFPQHLRAGVILHVLGGVAWLLVQSRIAGRLQHGGGPRLYTRFMNETPAGQWIATTRAGLRRPVLEPLCNMLDSLAKFTRGRVTVATLAVGLFLPLASASAAAMSGAVRPSTEQPSHEEDSTSQEPSPRPHVQQERSETPPSHPAQQAAPPDFTDVCGESLILPGEGAPPWAAQALWDLYFEPGSGAGALIAGCPGEARVSGEGLDQIAYHVGTNREGDLAGIALVSRRYGRALEERR